MISRADPRCTTARLAIGMTGLLVAIGTGIAAASYAISGINPLYFNQSSYRAPVSAAVNTGSGELSTGKAAFFPSPGDQYYYYRAPPVTASYDAQPIPTDDALDRDQRANTDRDDYPAAETSPSSESAKVELAVDADDTPADDELATEPSALQPTD